MRGIGGAEGDRTLDLCIANAALSQLSYRPVDRNSSMKPFYESRSLGFSVRDWCPGFLAPCHLIGVDAKMRSASATNGCTSGSGRVFNPLIYFGRLAG
jgi:hypothetical protein